MKTKSIYKISARALVMIAALGLSMSASAGVEGGNTELFRPVNAKGQPIAITFASKHPQQEKLVQMITAAALPTILKNELLSDLAGTAIMYSNEILTYGETQRQVQMVLSKIVKATTKDKDGNVSSTTQEEYSAADTGAKFGIYISPINLVIKDISDVYVAAYTQASPKRVVYFTDFLSQMSEDETLELVLHEQAHRISYLKDYRDDERFIEAWTSLFLKYLKGETTRDEFYRVLTSYKLETREIVGIPGEDYDSVYAAFRGVINVTVRAPQVAFVGLKDRKYVLQVTKDVFKDYPVFQGGDFQEIFITDYSQFVDKYFRDTLDAGGTITLPLKVEYKKTTTTDSNGRLVLGYSDQKASYDLEPGLKRLTEEVALLTQKHPFITGLDSGTRSKWGFSPSLYIDPEYFNELLQVVGRISVALSELKEELPELYQLVSVKKSDLISFDGAGVKVEKYLCETYGSCWFLGITSKENFRALTVQAIKEAFTKNILDKTFEYWKVLSRVNRRLIAPDSIALVTLEGDNENIGDASIVATAFFGNRPFISRLACVAQGLRNVSKEVSVSLKSAESISWSYGTGGGLKLTVPRNLLEHDSMLFRKFVFEQILTPHGTKNGEGEALWNAQKGEIKVAKRADVSTGDRLSSESFGNQVTNLLRQCSGMKPVRSGN